MPSTFWTGLCLYCLSTVKCGSSDVNATCSAKPAVEGQTGTIELHVNGIDFSTHQFRIILQKENKDILKCGDYETPAVTTCTIKNDRFEFDGKADENMTIMIPVVKQDMDGIFELQIHFKGEKLPLTSCEFNVSAHQFDVSTQQLNVSAAPAPQTEDLPIVPVVVPTVLVITALVAVVVFIAVRRRKRRGYAHTSANDDL